MQSQLGVASHERCDGLRQCKQKWTLPRSVHTRARAVTHSVCVCDCVRAPTHLSPAHALALLFVLFLKLELSLPTQHWQKPPRGLGPDCITQSDAHSHTHVHSAPSYFRNRSPPRALRVLYPPARGHPLSGDVTRECLAQPQGVRQGLGRGSQSV